MQYRRLVCLFLVLVCAAFGVAGYDRVSEAEVSQAFQRSVALLDVEPRPSPPLVSVADVAADTEATSNPPATAVPRTPIRVCESLVYTPPTARQALSGQWCDPTESGKSSVVVLVHGGGEVGGSASDNDVWRDIYLDAGIATFSINYTLGDAFNPEPLWPVPEQNVKAAVQFARMGGPSSPVDQVVVHGFSAGARLAALALTTPDDPWFHGDELWPYVSDAPDAATLFYGYFDGSTAWPHYFTDEPPPHASALTNVVEGAPLQASVLLVHGRQDFLVSEQQSMRLSAALVEAGATVDLQLIAGEASHGFDGYGTKALTTAGTELVGSVLANAARKDPRHEPVGEVLLIGDSIGNEIAPELERLLAARGASFNHITWWGIAPCDIVDVVDEHVANGASPVADTVVLLFTGNAITPCMEGSDDLASESYFETYERDVTTLVQILEPWSPTIWTVEALPARRSGPAQVAAELAQRLSQLDGVDGVVRFGDLFTDSLGRYAAALPCVLPSEPCDVVRIRADDGAHLGEDHAPHGRNRMAHAIVRGIFGPPGDRGVEQQPKGEQP